MSIEFDIKNYNDINPLIDDIIEVHKELFPTATLLTQIEKYEEEKQELLEANEVDKVIEEFADIFIVACGIKRFNDYLGTDLCNFIIKTITNYEDRIDLMKAVCNKMNKNQKRSWKETKDGYYKHKIHNIN